MLLAGARPFLQALAERGLLMCLASGTDEGYVQDEARLLGVAEFFGPHVYGARDDYEASGKKRVIDRLLRDTGISGRDLAVFGDGYVEIDCARGVGGYAVGVASDELAGGGTINPWKRDRLLRAGADVIVPDFADADGLIRLLFD
jgi:phosphoglycolate phosphatase-like HAD superfamily hydrolase